MWQRLWHRVWVRLVCAWLVIVWLPAGLVFWRYWASGLLPVTQINSLILSTLASGACVLLLNQFTKFPGQKSLMMVLPVLCLVVMTSAVVLLVFRVPYSVYYLTISSLVGAVFFFVSQYILRVTDKLTMAYVPIGRCLSLTEIKQVTWVSLDDDYQPQDSKGRFDALVADLSDDKLYGVWETKLAQTVLQGVPVYNVLQVRESLTGRIPIRHLYENNLGSLLPSLGYVRIKRIFDSLVIVTLSPIIVVLAVCVALGVKWQNRKTGGSVLFIQKRVGQGGKLFDMYKFRSMIPTSEAHGAKMATVNDVRITPFGRFIRKMRLDELPQFINVLKGDMSLIGPRPEQPDFVARFDQEIPFYRYRHIVKPGISGWAQVMQGYASDSDETKVKIEYDFFYIKNFSFSLDFLIVIKTIWTILTGFGAR